VTGAGDEEPGPDPYPRAGLTSGPTPEDREADRLARVGLARLTEPGDPRLAALVTGHGAAAVYAMLREERDATGLATEVAARVAGLDPVADLDRARAQGIRFVCPGDGEWPATLDDLDHCETVNGRGGAPLGLWVRGRGRLDQLLGRSVAVVGSRSATTYGAAVAGDLSANVAEEGVCVVSGAAFGIDQAAHRGALAARGPTVAVLACGADRAYPSAHRDLLEYIAETGAVVSESPPGCAPTRLRFLSRNRMIAAVALGTVVVEAALRSGALNTANWTSLLNRVLMGVPGPVTSASSEGVHEMLRTRGASLVTRGSDVLELVSPLGAHAPTVPRRGPDGAWDLLSELDRQVLDAVPAVRPAHPPAVARTAGLRETSVLGALERLRSAGLVERGSAGWRTASRAGGPAQPVN
jgi:DNA processing protein